MSDTDHGSPRGEGVPGIAVLDCALDLISVLNEDGSFRFANRAHEVLLGHDPEKLVGRSVFEFVHEDDRSGILEAFADGVSVTGRSDVREFRFRCADGTWRFLEAAARNLLDDPAIAGVVVTTRDVTRRRSAEQQLHGLHARERALSDLSRHALTAIRPEDFLSRTVRVVAEEVDVDFASLHEVDESGAVRLRASCERSPGTNDAANDGPDVDDGFAFLRGQKIRGGISIDIKGRERHVGALGVHTKSPRHFDAEEVRFLKGVARVVAGAMERVAAEEEQRREHDARVRLSATLAEVSEELLTNLASRRIGERMCRVIAKAVRADSCALVLRESTHEPVLPIASEGLPLTSENVGRLSEVVEAWSLPNGECELTDEPSSGTDEPTPTLRIPLRIAGDLVGLLVARRTTSPRRGFSSLDGQIASSVSHVASAALRSATLLDRLERANEIKAEFLGMMSHELRTPLNAIVGYDALILEGAFGEITAEQNEALEHIRISAENLTAIVNSTLQVSQLEQGRLPIDRASVRAPSVLERIEREFAQSAYDAGLGFDCEVEDDLPTLSTDEGKLMNALRCIVGNAIKFTPAGRVSIRARRLNDGVEFSVADTGVGMTAEILATAFQPFQQGDSSTTRRFDGVGLGLYIARQLTTLLGGYVRAESEPSAGSTLLLWIPADPAPALPAT